MNTIEYLGVEGGGTRTVAVCMEENGRILRRAEFGAGNVRLLNDVDLRKLFQKIASFCKEPRAIGVGMAGARDDGDCRRIGSLLHQIWENVPAVVTHDLEVALAAAPDSTKTTAKVLVLSGTGSCCYGRNRDRTEKVGGWGHILGDVGSAYAVAHEALRQLVFQYDRHKKWGSLGERVLRHLLLNHPNDLVAWAQSASKSEIAALAPCVFESRPDSVAKTAIDNAADALAKDAAICAARIASRRDEVQFVLAGGMLLKQPHFAKAVAKRIRRQWPFARIQPLKNEGAWGAARMARQAAVGQVQSPDRAVRAEDQSAVYVPDFVPENSPTEQRNPASTRLHELSTGKIVGVMLRAESDVIPALRKQRMQIVRAVEMAAQTLKAGGRIFYVGAGTSGRLGVLDASECPPTFRASPEMIQGLIAGGQRALWQAVEGAEDDAEAGATALRMRGVSRRDLVIGIAASGRTPFVWGALGMSRQLKAKTILLSFNPALKINPKQRPDLVIAPDVGPEILTGSTRLKSGTATKLVLNMISTISMVRMGKVIGNLMIDLNPSNVKLRNRAVRIVQQLTGVSEEKARDALERKHWVVKDAWIDLKRARAR